ncbi:MAG: hypothetical protein WKI04_15845, partial [Ferruginibacter sp.]
RLGNLLLFGLFIILLLAVQFTSPRTVEEIIEKFVVARGGNSNLLSVKSIYMEGVIEIQGKGSAIRMIKVQDKLSRTEIETSAGNTVLLITDREACTIFPLISPAVNKLPLESLAELQIETDLCGPLVDHLEKGHKAELLGKDTVDGNPSYKIKITTKSGKVMKYWIDTGTYLVNKSSAVHLSRKNINIDSIVFYGNYKKINGIQFAHTIEIRSSETNESASGEEITFNTILVNTIIDPSMFIINNYHNK